MAVKKAAVPRQNIVVRESNAARQWTLAYRSGMVGSSALVIAMVSYIGNAMLTDQRAMGRDISDLRTDLTSRVSGMDSVLGDARGRIDMLQNRANRTGDAVNKSNQDIAVLQQRVNDLQARQQQVQQ